MESLISHLESGANLSSGEIEMCAEFLLDLEVLDENKQRLLLALSRKGETPDEIAGFVEVFLQHAVNPEMGELELKGPTIDVCGTGGDQLDLFNVSTTAMFIAAACGAVVVKHGNRGITSKSGGADVLEALGVRIDLGPEGFRKCLHEAGIGFLFAPHYHPAFKAVAGVRKNLAAAGHRSIFNLIGPLLNPARPEYQLVGVSEAKLCSTYAEILKKLGRKKAWVVSGLSCDGRSVDEISTMGATEVHTFDASGSLSCFSIEVEDFGFKSAFLSELQGGDAQANAIILKNILSGEDRGPKAHMVMLNAAAAMVCAGLASDLHQGLEKAREAIENGAAIERLRQLQRACA